MLKPNFDNIPDELKQYRQWVNWKSLPRKEGEKPTKPPFMPSGKLARTNDPTTWSHFLTTQSAYRSAANEFDGVGFVLKQEGGTVAVDFDNCRCPGFDGIDEEISGGLNMVLPEIADHIRRLNTYTEVSPSGKGIRIFAKASLPVAGKRKGPIEIYKSGRYVTVTGHILDGFPRTIEPRQMEIDTFYQSVFGAPEEPHKQEKKTRTESAPGDWRAIIEKAFESKSGSEIRLLWNGDHSAYPSQSEGDMALCSHLAFWLGRNAAAMDSAFRESGLFRKKWDEKHGECTYGEATIKKAIYGSTAFYGEVRQSQEREAKAPPEEWSVPLPLPDGLPPVKPLDPAMIPAPLRGWLMDIANRMQIPPDFSTAAAVVALGAIIGRGCGIYPKRHDDWLVVPNLWGAVVGRPSLMKTPAVSEAQRHLNRLEAEARADYQVAADAFEIDKEIMKITKAAIGADIKKAVTAGKDIEEGRGKLANLQHDKPTRRRNQTSDGTTEKIGELLIESPRGLLVKRDELMGWFRSLDKDGREGDRAFYLEAWNGDQSFTYDRIGRGTLDIPALCVSIFGAITPGPLSNYVYQANRGGNGDDGLLQRFQVFVWPDAPTEWNNIDRFPDTAEKNRAWHIFKTLSGDIPGALMEEGAEIPGLRFSPGGQDVFDTWRQALETRLLSDHGLHPAMESHLTKYRKLMPALALIFHLVGVADGTETGQVSDRVALMAAAWCDYLESHAGRIYGAATMPGMEAAREIVKHIRRGAIQNGATVREIWRHQWSRLSSSENVKAGLEVLQEYEWLFLEKITTGGRASELVRLNPGIKL